MSRYFILPLLTCNIILADDLVEKADTNINKSQNSLPALELLPTGSILKKISITRSNKNYTPASLLTADQFEVISGQEIQGRNVSISIYDAKGKIKTKTKLNNVNFNQTTGLITSKENLIFTGDTFTASSQGVTLDWENHRGFLLGKNQTIIYLKVPISMTNSPSTSQQAVKKTTKANNPSKIGVAATAVTLVTSPTFLSAQDLAQIDQLAQPSTALFIEQLDQTKAALAAPAEAEAKIATIQKELAEQLGAIPKIDADQPAPAELVPVKGKDFIKITSDRLLFDAKKGIFVYHGNVRITHPKYSFSCDGELKIILSEAAAAKKMSPEERAKLKPNDIFDDISQIIATKNVIIRGKDNKGNPVSGITENLSYNKATGNIILKGKGSRITTADGQLKVITQNGYLRLDQNMNASGQGAKTEFNIPDNAKKP